VRRSRHGQRFVANCRGKLRKPHCDQNVFRSPQNADSCSATRCMTRSSGPRRHLPKFANGHCGYSDVSCACLIVLMMPRWLHEVRMTRPLPLTKKLVPISCSKSSGMKAPVFFAGDILSGKHPKPLMMPTFSLVGCSGFSELTCAILPVTCRSAPRSLRRPRRAIRVAILATVDENYRYRTAWAHSIIGTDKGRNPC
jgi:hypothetical protein